MSSTNHTPGPWTIEESRTYPGRKLAHTIEARESCVTVASLCGAEPDDREAQEAQAADARLIAAAPAMLAACEALIHGDDLQRAIDLARAALRLARGDA